MLEGFVGSEAQGFQQGGKILRSRCRIQQNLRLSEIAARAVTYGPV